jgi:hypothetical protein
MGRLIKVAGCVALLYASSARADSNDEILKRVIPDRDLSKAVLKIVDPASGCYAIGNSLDITKDGDVRTTDAVIVELVGHPNTPNRYSYSQCSRMKLKFAKPVRMPSDLAGNKIVGIELGN